MSPLLALLGILFACELLAPSFPFVGQLGMAAHVTAYFILVAHAFRDAAWMIGEARDRRAILTPLTIVALAVGFFGGTAAMVHVSYDSAQIVRCALDQFADTADAGFRHWCFLGYPTRALAMTAVPSLFAGPSVVAMNLVPPLLLVSGLFVFARRLLEQWGVSWRTDAMTAFLLSLLLQCDSFLSWLFQYDVTVVPMALALWLAAALLALWRDEKNALLTVGVILAVAGSAYTPALPVFAVGIACLAYRAWHAPTATDRHALVLVAIPGIVVLLSSLTYREDIRLFAASGAPAAEMLRGRFAELLGRLVFRNIQLPDHRPLLAAVFLFTLGRCLVGREGWKGLLAGLAMVAIFAITVVVKGWTYQPVYVVLYRVFPLFPLIFFLAARWIEPLTRRWPRAVPALLAAGCLFVLTTDGPSRLYAEAFRRDRADKLDWLFWLRGERERGVFPVDAAIHITPELRHSLASIADAGKYFVPRARIEFLADDCSAREVRSKSIFYFTQADGRCPPPNGATPVALVSLVFRGKVRRNYVLAPAPVSLVPAGEQSVRDRASIAK